MELAMEKISSPTELHKAFLKICETFVQPGNKQAATEAEDSSVRQLALCKEIEDLRHNVIHVKTQHQRKTALLSTKLWKMMQQNTSLIEEINIFRQEITGLRARLQLLNTALQSADPRQKDDYTSFQALLKEAETAQTDKVEKSSVIEQYQQELRRLHLLHLLMREVIKTDASPGVQEMMAKLQDIQLPLVVRPSKIDLISKMVEEEVTKCTENLGNKYSGAGVSSLCGLRGNEVSSGENSKKQLIVVFPKPETKAVVPAKQLQFFKNLITTVQLPPVELTAEPGAQPPVDLSRPEIPTPQLISALPTPFSHVE
jgi:hypothetical protein